MRAYVRACAWCARVRVRVRMCVRVCVCVTKLGFSPHGKAGTLLFVEQLMQ